MIVAFISAQSLKKQQLSLCVDYSIQNGIYVLETNHDSSLEKNYEVDHIVLGLEIMEYGRHIVYFGCHHFDSSVLS